MKETLYPTLLEGEIAIKGIHDGFCERCKSKSDKLKKDRYGRLFCLECESLGSLYEDEFLYRHERMVDFRMHSMAFPYQLSYPQQKGSQFFLDCIRNHRGGFLEAVCGAGKTEMLYAGLLELLNRHQRICLAIPRKQVVIELTSRLKAIFPNTIIKALYDEAKDDEYAHILVSTIHQLVHYDQEFDVIILDEVDAFPLVGNPLLNRLIEKSLKKGGMKFMMSATVSKDKADELVASQTDRIFIPSRFHGHSLDIPKFIHDHRLDFNSANCLFSKSVWNILHKWIDKNQKIFIFVPTIRLAEKVYEYLSIKISGGMIFTSQTKNKQQILSDFSKGMISFIVTTSILERGVTYPNLNCMILYSDHAIYTKEMLIQISGRVGRKADSPHGEIYFVSKYKSQAMIEAVKHLSKMNQEAERLLHDMQNL